MKFNKKLFRKAIKQTIKDRKLTIREASVQSGIPISSLSTLQRDRVPDLLTYFKVCIWTGNDPLAFITTTQDEWNVYKDPLPDRCDACVFGRVDSKTICLVCNGTGVKKKKEVKK